MRTSGRSTDSPLAFVPIGAALLLIVVLAGGPSAFLAILEQSLRAIAATVAEAVRAAV